MAAAVTARMFVRLAVTAGLAVAAWLLSLLFSATASASESTDTGDGGGGLLGVVSSTTGALTSAVSDTVDTTLHTVTDTLDTATKVVGGTLDTVTGVVDETVDAVAPAPKQPAAQPIAVTPVAESSTSVQKATKAKSADRSKSKRAPVHSDVAQPTTDVRVADLARTAAPTSSASGGTNGSGGGQLPTAPCSTTAAAASAADSAGKKLFALAADAATAGRLNAAGTGSAQPAAATVAAASLPCTSPD